MVHLARHCLKEERQGIFDRAKEWQI